MFTYFPKGGFSESNGYVPTTRTVNGKALEEDIIIGLADITDGDETLEQIIDELKDNSGSVDLSGYVPVTRTINGKPLNKDITIDTGNVSAKVSGGDWAYEVDLGRSSHEAHLFIPNETQISGNIVAINIEIQCLSVPTESVMHPSKLTFQMMSGLGNVGVPITDSIVVTKEVSAGRLITLFVPENVGVIKCKREHPTANGAHLKARIVGVLCV